MNVKNLITTLFVSALTLQGNALDVKLPETRIAEVFAREPKVVKVIQNPEPKFVRQKTRTGCFRACSETVKSIGLELLPSSDLFQTALEKGGKLVRSKTKGRAYLDSLFRQGLPAVVGVSHTLNYKISGEFPNKDRTTDHFIVLLDFDRFFDPADGKFKRLSRSKLTISQIRKYDTRTKRDC